MHPFLQKPAMIHDFDKYWLVFCGRELTNLLEIFWFFIKGKKRWEKFDSPVVFNWHLAYWDDFLLFFKFLISNVNFFFSSMDWHSEVKEWMSCRAYQVFFDQSVCRKRVERTQQVQYVSLTFVSVSPRKSVLFKDSLIFLRTLDRRCCLLVSWFVSWHLSLFARYSSDPDAVRQTRELSGLGWQLGCNFGKILLMDVRCIFLTAEHRRYHTPANKNKRLTSERNIWAQSEKKVFRTQKTNLIKTLDYSLYSSISERASQIVSMLVNYGNHGFKESSEKPSSSAAFIPWEFDVIYYVSEKLTASDRWWEAEVGYWVQTVFLLDSPSKLSAFHVFSPCLKCAVTSCREKIRKISVTRKYEIRMREGVEVSRHTLRSCRHTVVRPSSDKRSLGNSFANLKTWSLKNTKWFSMLFREYFAKRQIQTLRSKFKRGGWFSVNSKNCFIFYLWDVALRCCSMQLFPNNTGNSITDSNKVSIFTVWSSDTFMRHIVM